MSERSEKEAWLVANRRRCELIENSISGVLNAGEFAELEKLQEHADWYLDKVAPRPDAALNLFAKLAGIDQAERPAGNKVKQFEGSHRLVKAVQWDGNRDTFTEGLVELLSPCTLDKAFSVDTAAIIIGPFAVAKLAGGELMVLTRGANWCPVPVNDWVLNPEHGFPSVCTNQVFQTRHKLQPVANNSAQLKSPGPPPAAATPHIEPTGASDQDLRSEIHEWKTGVAAALAGNEAWPDASTCDRTLLVSLITPVSDLGAVNGMASELVLLRETIRSLDMTPKWDHLERLTLTCPVCEATTTENSAGDFSDEVLHPNDCLWLTENQRTEKI